MVRYPLLPWCPPEDQIVLLFLGWPFLGSLMDTIPYRLRSIELIGQGHKGCMVKRSPAAYLLFFLLLAVLFAPGEAAAAGQSPRHVLLLTSYHQGDRWNDSIVQDVREAMGSLESLSLSIENLDMRRYTDQDHTRITTVYIRAKYQGRPQDLVLVADDPALNFLLTVREDIFPNASVVFCGVNNFTPKRIQGQHNIIGINEALLLAPHYGIATRERLCG